MVRSVETCQFWVKMLLKGSVVILEVRSVETCRFSVKC